MSLLIQYIYTYTLNMCVEKCISDCDVKNVYICIIVCTVVDMLWFILLYLHTCHIHVYIECDCMSYIIILILHHLIGHEMQPGSALPSSQNPSSFTLSSVSSSGCSKMKSARGVSPKRGSKVPELHVYMIDIQYFC